MPGDFFLLLFFRENKGKKTCPIPPAGFVREQGAPPIPLALLERGGREA